MYSVIYWVGWSFIYKTSWTTVRSLIDLLIFSYKILIPIGIILFQISAFELLKMYFEVFKNQVMCGFYSTNVDNIYFMLNLRNNLD